MVECEPRLETSTIVPLSREDTLPPRRPCNQDRSRVQQRQATYDTRMETDSVLITAWTVEEAAVSIAIVV